MPPRAELGRCERRPRPRPRLPAVSRHHELRQRAVKTPEDPDCGGRGGRDGRRKVALLEFLLGSLDQANPPGGSGLDRRNRAASKADRPARRSHQIRCHRCERGLPVLPISPSICGRNASLYKALAAASLAVPSTRSKAATKSRGRRFRSARSCARSSQPSGS